MKQPEHDALRAYLQKLDLPPAMADIYIALQAHGAQTISELARNAKVDRIKIYRILDELKASGLVEMEVQYKRNIIRPAPITNLQMLITKKEQELEDIKQDYPRIAAGFNRQTLGANAARVQFYEGADGLKQMLWKQTKSKGENLSILHGNMQHKTNLAFFERWTKKCNQAGITFRSVIDDHFLNTQDEWYTHHANEKLAHWQGRRIGDDFPLTYSTVIYGDTVLQYNWSDTQVFGIETISPDIAQMQRQFFELLWKQSQPLPDHQKSPSGPDLR